MNGCYYYGHSCQEAAGKFTTEMKRARMCDLRRYAYLTSQGYNLLILWGCDIEHKPRTARRKLREAARRMDT